MQVVLILIAFLPIKNSWMGFNLTSVTEIPTLFSYEVQFGGVKADLDLGINYTKSDQTSEFDTITTTNESSTGNLMLSLGYKLLFPTLTFDRGSLPLNVVYGFGQSVSYWSGKDEITTRDGEAETNTVKTRGFSFSLSLLTGLEMGFKYKRQFFVRVLATPITVSYSHDKETIEDTQETKSNTFRISGVNLFSGPFKLWLFMKL
jgi:hypothetical protein